MLRLIAVSSKSVSAVERRYSNMERKALAMGKFHHYCLVMEVSMITDHKSLVAILKEDLAALSQRLQCLLLRIHQYRVRIIYKHGPDQFIGDWLSRQNHKENKYNEIPGMKINTNAVHMTTDIPNCMTAKKYNR